jgi:DNA invertase Pin-like site-specific DNA recombinase
VSTVVYARVSTAEQDLGHQRERLFEHAVEELGVDAEEIDVIEDRSTGTDVDRGGYRELMERVEAGEVDRVVVRSVSRVARNMRDLQNMVGEIIKGGAALHFVADGLALDPGSEGGRRWDGHAG